MKLRWALPELSISLESPCNATRRDSEPRQREPTPDLQRLPSFPARQRPVVERLLASRGLLGPIPFYEGSPVRVIESIELDP